MKLYLILKTACSFATEHPNVINIVLEKRIFIFTKGVLLYFTHILSYHSIEKIIFKAVQNSSLSIPVWKRSIFVLNLWFEKKFTINLFPTRTHPKSGFDHKEIVCLFINNETDYTVHFFFNSASHSVFMVLNLKTFILQDTRCSIIFRHQRVLPALLGSISQACIDILPRNSPHGITGWFYTYKIYSI